MMDQKHGVHGIPLAQSGYGMIELCVSNGYHVIIKNVMLHLNQDEFNAMADLFQQAREETEASLYY